MKVCSVLGSFSSAMQGSEETNYHQDDETGGVGTSDFFNPSYENYTQPDYPFRFE